MVSNCPPSALSSNRSHQRRRPHRRRLGTPRRGLLESFFHKARTPARFSRTTRYLLWLLRSVTPWIVRFFFPDLCIMSNNKVKASWDINTTKVLIDLCLKQLNVGNRRGATFSRVSWEEIVNGFTAQTQRVYSRIQLKNKYDALQKEYQLWNRLLKETGVGWDVDRKTINAPDDWWEKKILEVPEYEKFRLRGLQFQDELLQLFGGVVATGRNQWAPSSSIPPPQSAPPIDSKEGSADSHDVEGARTGVSAGLQYVNFNDLSGGSVRRRTNTRGGGGGRSIASLGVNMGDAIPKEAQASKQMVEAMKQMVEEARADRIEREERAAKQEERAAKQEERAAKREEASIRAVLSHLETVEEIVADEDFFVRCTDFLERDQSAREVYAAWKNSKGRLLHYLKRKCYGTNM